MNAEQINARIEELKNQERMLQANLNAVTGAIQDCQYWLSKIPPTLDIEQETEE